MLRKLRSLFAEEVGSASVEFVLLAIPLFLPILIFLAQFDRLSNSELIARNLVRESLRAYVTSSNPVSAPSRAQEVLLRAAREQGLTESEIRNLDLSFQCSEFPCLSPNGRVRATLKLRLGNDNRIVTSQAQEFISPWQWNGIGPGLVSRLEDTLNVQL